MEIVITGATVLTMLLVAVVGAYAEDYHVKTDGQDLVSFDGLSWPKAWRTIEYALGKATSGDVIHIKAGIYSPTATNETFPISIGCSHDGIKLLGAGMGMTILDAEGSDSNKRRVLTLAGIKDDCTLDDFVLEGFTITGGYVTGSDDSDYAEANGGGIYCYLATNLLIKDCEITGNDAKGSYASRDGDTPTWCDWGTQDPPGLAGGGGIYLRDCYTGIEPITTIDNCLIHDNVTGMGGGGICSNYAPALIKHTCIHTNTASRGAGLYMFDYTLSGQIEHIVFNDLIVENSIGGVDDHDGNYYRERGEGYEGGGAYMCSWGYPLFSFYNVTVTDNAGYEVYMSQNCKNITFKGRNNIFWPDGDVEDDCEAFRDDGYEGEADVMYSDICYEGSAYPGQDDTDGKSHNICEDPLFEHYGDYEVICQRYFLERPPAAVSPIDSGTSDSAKTYHPAEIMDTNPFTTDVRGYYDGSNKPSVEYPCGGDEMDMGYHYRTFGASYVQLASFTARASRGDVVLSWETGTEIDNAGFVIYRSDAGLQDYCCISGLIGAEGTAASGASYSFVDEDVGQGAHYEYWLVDIDTSGKWTAHGPAFARVPVLVEPIRIERELVHWRAVR